MRRGFRAGGSNQQISQIPPFGGRPFACHACRIYPIPPSVNRPTALGPRAVFMAKQYVYASSVPGQACRISRRMNVPPGSFSRKCFLRLSSINLMRGQTLMQNTSVPF
ncbi:hypothetical protein CENSYa_0903 [Cenarchaeum symbiosum A]|uniref:Uncharacterized protein n=1 Tax=Cenarchaeum symbiosum (strain A) TaxID=414004 RepID=A0RW18_CENSY|nr:hypothetical protein CENSYa_0903 [Cenarchaeum symbiosum A]